MRRAARNLFATAVGVYFALRVDITVAQYPAPYQFPNAYPLPAPGEVVHYPCVASGEDSTILDQEDLYQLCAGARSDAPIACYDLGSSSTVLTSEDLFALCEAATSTAPVSCYNSAREETLIDPLQAIQLCQCARDNTPVACYAHADASHDFDQSEILAMCSAATLYHYAPGCRPYVGVLY